MKRLESLSYEERKGEAGSLPPYDLAPDLVQKRRVK